MCTVNPKETTKTAKQELKANKPTKEIRLYYEKIIQKIQKKKKSK